MSHRESHFSCFQGQGDRNACYTTFAHQGVNGCSSRSLRIRTVVPRIIIRRSYFELEKIHSKASSNLSTNSRRGNSERVRFARLLRSLDQPHREWNLDLARRIIIRGADYHGDVTAVEWWHANALRWKNEISASS